MKRTDRAHCEMLKSYCVSMETKNIPVGVEKSTFSTLYFYEHRDFSLAWWESKKKGGAFGEETTSLCDEHPCMQKILHWDDTLNNIILFWDYCKQFCIPQCNAFTLTCHVCVIKTKSISIFLLVEKAVGSIWGVYDVLVC